MSDSDDRRYFKLSCGCIVYGIINSDFSFIVDHGDEPGHPPSFFTVEVEPISKEDAMAERALWLAISEMAK